MSAASISTASRPRGFTLVELLVVLVILAVAVGAAAPALRRPTSRGGDDVGHALVAVVDEARAAALRRGATVVVALELSTGGFRIALGPTGSAVGDTLRTGRLRLGAARLEGGRDGWATWAFDALGTARADRVWIVDLEERHEMVVTPWTGAAELRLR